ncbi:hypothetical protein [Phyllobacterium bourgognense]|nr:hypothetical protein [Phyllobacterium bourgognense]
MPILILRILDEEKILQQELEGYSDYTGKYDTGLYPVCGERAYLA